MHWKRIRELRRMTERGKEHQHFSRAKRATDILHYFREFHIWISMEDVSASTQRRWFKKGYSGPNDERATIMMRRLNVLRDRSSDPPPHLGRPPNVQWTTMATRDIRAGETIVEQLMSYIPPTEAERIKHAAPPIRNDRFIEHEGIFLHFGGIDSLLYNVDSCGPVPPLTTDVLQWDQAPPGALKMDEADWQNHPYGPNVAFDFHLRPRHNNAMVLLIATKDIPSGNRLVGTHYTDDKHFGWPLHPMETGGVPWTAWEREPIRARWITDPERFLGGREADIWMIWMP